MSAELWIKPDAEYDLVEAYDWYEEQRAGLGDEFLLCAEAVFESARPEPPTD